MTNGLEFQESLKAREKRTCWVEWTAGKRGGARRSGVWKMKNERKIEGQRQRLALDHNSVQFMLKADRGLYSSCFYPWQNSGGCDDTANMLKTLTSCLWSKQVPWYSGRN